MNSVNNLSTSSINTCHSEVNLFWKKSDPMCAVCHKLRPVTLIPLKKTVTNGNKVLSLSLSFASCCYLPCVYHNILLSRHRVNMLNIFDQSLISLLFCALILNQVSIKRSHKTYLIPNIPTTVTT